MERLYRSESDRMLGGVCGGIAEYYDVDPSLVRVATVLVILGTGMGLFAYIFAWLIIPAESEVEGTESKENSSETSEQEE